MHTKENLELIGRSLGSSKSRFFFLFFPDGAKSDKIVGNPYFSSTVVDRMINYEIIDSVINAAKKEEPNWVVLHNSIKKKYNGLIADRNVLNAKIAWYAAYKKKDEWVVASLEKLTKYGTDMSTIDGMGACNSLGWYLFLNSNNLKHLNAVLKFMKGVVNSPLNRDFPTKPNWDTYANLLYKVGKVKEAILWQQKAIEETEKWPDLSSDEKKTLEEYKTVVNKMRNGEPTLCRQGSEMEFRYHAEENKINYYQLREIDQSSKA